MPDPLAPSPLWLSDTAQLGRRQMTVPALAPLPTHLKPGPEEQYALLEQARQIVAASVVHTAAITQLRQDLLDLQRQLWPVVAQEKQLRARWRTIRRRLTVGLEAQEAAYTLLRVAVEDLRAQHTQQGQLLEQVQQRLLDLDARTWHGRWVRLRAWLASWWKD